MTDQGDIAAKLEALRSLLTTASGLVADVANDPDRDRFLRVYDRIPRQDRRALLDILEREVGLRTTTLEEGAAITGYRGHVNPNARLYVRVIEKTPNALPALDHDQMVYSNLRAARIMRLVLAPHLHDAWHVAAIEAFGMLEADERADAARVLRELLEIADLGTDRAAKPIAATG